MLRNMEGWVDLMPEDGDKADSYCRVCGTSATHVYSAGPTFGDGWKCLGCGTVK